MEKCSGLPKIFFNVLLGKIADIRYFTQSVVGRIEETRPWKHEKKTLLSETLLLYARLKSFPEVSINITMPLVYSRRRNICSYHRSAQVSHSNCSHYLMDLAYVVQLSAHRRASHYNIHHREHILFMSTKENSLLVCILMIN